MGCTMSLINSCGDGGEDDVLVSVCKERKQLMKSAVERRYILGGAHFKYNQSLYAVALALRFFISRHSTSQFLITTTTEPEAVCKHFYDDVVVDGGVMTSSTLVNDGWDFFNPINNILVTDVDVIESAKSKVEDKLIDEEEEMELLEALKHVEDYFLKAYDSGSDFSKMLEFTNLTPPLDSNENFTPSINIYKSSITRSPSCASLLSSSSRSSSTWTGSDLFDHHTGGGMESGSHLSTLGRLYAWEKKLYDEVKAGNEMKKIYDRKSSQLSSSDNTNSKRGGGVEDQVNDLYSRLLVSVKMCDSISKRIEKVTDEELVPQLVELLRGFIKSWKVMLESHKSQSRIMFKVKNFSFSGTTNDRCRHLATLQLEAEIQNWNKCFATYITSTEAYVEALSQWAYISIAPEHTPPPVFSICRNWLTVIKNLPDKAVTYAMKRFAKDLRTLWAQQEIEQQQKRKVDRLVAAFDKEERNILYLKSMNVKNKVHVLGDKKAQLERSINIVEAEKAKQKECVEETRRIILVGFQTGFSCVFDSLTEFCEVCISKYGNVAQNATLGPNRVRGY